jgi:hypothetical protein
MMVGCKKGEAGTLWSWMLPTPRREGACGSWVLKK